MEMIAQLDETSMIFVVKGRDGRSGGLIGCCLSPRPNSYDHTRHRQLKDEGTPWLPLWDFVIHREDGTMVRLHPQANTVNVETLELHPKPPPQRKGGKGGRWGLGKYRQYKDIGTKELLRFDARKGQQLQPFKNQ